MLLDTLGALTSLLSTYYFIRLDNRAWFITLLATSLNGFLYWQKGIYADMVLESFYFLSTCYGLYMWRRPIKQEIPAIFKLSRKQWFFLLAFIISFYAIIVNLLSTFTHSDIPVLDALTTSLSLAAQWLMCHKAIATWILWFFTDALYAYMYLHKQLPFHCILMGLYTGMAVAGYWSWTKFCTQPTKNLKHDKYNPWLSGHRDT